MDVHGLKSPSCGGTADQHRKNLVVQNRNGQTSWLFRHGIAVGASGLLEVPRHLMMAEKLAKPLMA